MVAVTPRQHAWVKYLGFTNLKTNMPRSHASVRGQFEGNANKDLSSCGLRRELLPLVKEWSPPNLYLERKKKVSNSLSNLLTSLLDLDLDQREITSNSSLKLNWIIIARPPTFFHSALAIFNSN